tara:strand:- start:323 stop:532 length:210 start_codon:yes stop_codon:yes gene_type:complete
MSKILEDNPSAFDERYIKRIEDAVDIHVDNMDLEDLIQYTAHSLKDYYVNEASGEEVEEFLRDNEPLPF